MAENTELEAVVVENTAMEAVVAENTSDYDVADSSGSEYVPSELEMSRLCSMCEEEVFIACPESDCLALLCYDHRLTGCSEHKDTTLSVSRADAAANLLAEYTTDDDALTAPKASGKSTKSRERRSSKSTTQREKKNTRKRMRNEKQWHRVRSKRAREMGQEYVTSTGRTVPAKGVPEGALCGEKCRRQCNRKVHVAARQQIFDSYYKMDTNSQNAYIFKSAEPCKPKMQRLDAKKHRSLSFRYKVIVDGESVYVCRNAFILLHQISHSKVKHITDQIISGATAPHPCLSGRHSNRPNRISAQSFQEVTEHIKLFPTESSHYSRSKNMSRSYLSSQLSIEKMYDLYCEWKKSKDSDRNEAAPVSEPEVPLVSKRSYRDIFNTNFNYGFGMPRSDTCATCDSGGNESHKDNAASAFREQKQDRDFARMNQNAAYITFDLEKTLPLPKLSTGTAFYLRQMWIYNAGIHLITNNDSRAYFHVWTESQAKRGCEEIGSCLLAFVEDTGIGSTEEPCRLVAWCDSCAGQNKNFFIICLWQYLILTKNFCSIEQKFPEPGHSYLDSDRDFAQIEKLVRKEQNIYTVDKYINLFIQSQKRRKPSVMLMNGKFFSMKELPKLLHLFNNHVDSEGERVKFRDAVRWIRVTEFGSYQYRESFEETSPWKTVDIKRHSGRPELNVEQVHLQPKTQLPLLSSAKLTDLGKQLCYVPTVYRPFYQALIDRGNSSHTAADSDVTMSESEDCEPSDMQIATAKSAVNAARKSEAGKSASTRTQAAGKARARKRLC